MRICKKSIALLESVYTRCLTLREFRSEYIYTRDKAEYQSDLNYENLLDNVIVGMPNLEIGISDHGNSFVNTVEQFNKIVNGLQYAFFCWKDESLPQLPVFNRRLYYELCCDIGTNWFIHLFRYFGLFAMIPNNNCLWQIGGRLTTDRYYEKNRAVSSGEPVTKKRKVQHEVANVDFECLKVDVIIKWRKLLYDRNYSPGFSQYNLIDKLSKKPWNEMVGVELIRTIWAQNEDIKKVTELSQMPSCFDGPKLSDLLHQFLENHEKFDFMASFKVHCSVWSSNEGIMPVEIKKVIRFVRAVIFKVFPVQLLGSRNNLTMFQKFVSYSLRLGLGDQPSVEHLLSKMKLDCHVWLNISSDREDSLRDSYQLLLDLLVWMLNEYLYCCLSSFFYITEMDGQNKKLFYYSKTSWKYMEIQMMEELVNSETYLLLEDPQVQLPNFNQVITKRLRFVPKKVPTDELRPILSVQQSDKEKNEKTQRQLKKDLYVLNYVLSNDIMYRGCSLHHREGDTGNFQYVWQNFVQKVRTNNISQLYFVRLDIKNCFTNINHDKLSEILQQLSEKLKFKEIWLRPHFIFKKTNNKLRMTYTRSATAPGTSFGKLSQANGKKHGNKVVINLNRVEVEFIKKVIPRVNDEVNKNIISFNHKFYQQIRGLSQGGSLSQSLCNIYFGHMEHNYMQDYLKNDLCELLTRYVDDYLFVTPDKERAEKFKTDLDEGLSHYDASLNHSKMATNFACKWTQIQSQFISYFGFHIDTSTLDINVDYSRSQNKFLSHRFNVEAGNGLEPIKSMLFRNANLGQKWFLIDGRVCGRKSIVRGLYEFFLMLMFKFYSGLSRLPISKRTYLQQNFKEIFDVVTSCIDHIEYQVKMKKIESNLVYPFQNKLLKWICMQAAIDKFRRHRRQYQQLVYKFHSLQVDLESGLKLNKKKKRFFINITKKSFKSFKTFKK